MPFSGFKKVYHEEGPQLDIYHNQSIHERNGRGAKLTPLPIKQTFFWEGQEIYIPAVYVGKAGVVLDVCAKISLEDMTGFLQKWDQYRRLSLKTQEDFEQMESENPAARDFTVEISLDQIPLADNMSSSLYWYPPSIFQLLKEESEDEESGAAQEHTNSHNAEELMEAYGCDRACLWRISRHSFDWNDRPILSPQNLSLTLRADTFSVTAGHFTTNSSCDYSDKKTIKILHPVTGKEYTLTLHGCEQTKADINDITEENLIYPECLQELSYTISPQISREFFDILDCAESEPARTREGDGNNCSSDGPTAIFLAGKSSNDEFQAAVSSLHFAPVATVRWRIVFHIRPKEDIQVTLQI